MTLPRAFDMIEAWGKAPPVHVMLAAYMGVKGSSEGQQSQQTDKVASESDWEELAAAMGTTLQRTKREPEQP